jgi:heme-degrading monooxygenase HmoA
VSRGVEEPTHYIVRIEWDSLEGHEQGFRKSREFAGFFEAVKPFFEQIEEMRHYGRTAVASTG